MNPFNVLHNVVLDSLCGPLVAIANALVAWAAWRLSACSQSEPCLAQRLLRALLIWLATVVIITTSLGSCGILYGWLLMAVGSLFGLLALVLSAAIRQLSVRNETSGCRRVSSVELCSGRRVVHAIYAGWCLVLACVAGYVVANGVLSFPNEFDGLAYHIPLVDHWLQNHSLYAPESSHWWVPGNAEIVGLWFVAPFSGDFLISLGNLPFITLWAVSGLDVARQIGLSVVWRHLAVLAMLAVHTSFHEAEKAMNDVAVSATFFAAVACVFQYFNSGRREHLAFAGVAMGMLAGIKYFALGYACLIAGVTIAGAALVWGWRAALRTSATLFLVALPFGGYWYLRNYWLVGTPLYPQGTDALETVYPDIWRTTFAGNDSRELLPLAAKALWSMTGPCHVAAIVCAPLAALLLARSGVARLYGTARSEAGVLLGFCIFMLGTAVVLAITPFCIEDQPGSLNHLRWAYTPARYGLCFLSIAEVAGVWLLQQSLIKAVAWIARRVMIPSGRQSTIVIGSQVLCTAVIGWQIYLRLCYLRNHAELRDLPDLCGAAFLGLSLFAAGCLLAQMWGVMAPYRRIIGTVSVVSLLVGASVSVAVLSRHWHRGYGLHFDALRGTTVFSRLATEHGQTIAVLDHRPYPFFGSARQHRVCSPWALNAYDDLTAFLDLRRAQVVASSQRNIGNAFDRYKHGPEWLRLREAQFIPLVVSGEFELYTYLGLASPHNTRKRTRHAKAEDIRESTTFITKH